MKIRISASVINFRDKVLWTWKLEEWGGLNDPDKDVLFFGLYNDRDFAVFDLFKGNKSIFWCGSDLSQVVSDYERIRVLKNNPSKHYCENEVEANELKSIGVEPIIVPSFLGDINEFPVSFVPTKEPHIFLCGHNNRENEYGIGFIDSLAKKIPFATFHIYGIDKNSVYCGDNHKNIVYHGKVSEEQFNNEVKNYQCGLRINEHDGFSEVTAKSLLCGGYPITKIPYEKIWSYNTEDELVFLIEKLRDTTEPNTEVREFYINKINKFPFLCDTKLV